ncbi:MAG TPA: hypothetical protein VF331_26555 [Polyangiales bacterium]
MTWSVRCCEGFALAATIAADRAGGLAALGLSPAARMQLCALSIELSELPRAARRARVKRLTEARPIASQQAGRSARGLGWLASQASVPQARAWATSAALPRPGFAPEPALVALLRRIAETEPGS